MVALSFLVVLAANAAVYALKLSMRASSNSFIAKHSEELFSAMLALTISVVNAGYVIVSEKVRPFENAFKKCSQVFS